MSYVIIRTANSSFVNAVTRSDRFDERRVGVANNYGLREMSYVIIRTANSSFVEEVTRSDRFDERRVGGANDYALRKMSYVIFRTANPSFVKAVTRSDRLEKVKHHAALQRAVERKLHTAKATLSRGQVAAREQGRQFTSLLQAYNESQGLVAGLQLTNGEVQTSLDAYRRECAILQERLAGEQQERSEWQQRASNAESRAFKAETTLQRVCEQGRALEAQLAGVAQVAAPSTSLGPRLAPPPAVSQVPADLLPVLSWIQDVNRCVPLNIDEGTVIPYLLKNADNKPALAAEVEKFKAHALDATTGVQLPFDKLQTIFAFVQKGPPGWAATPIVPQGHATAQAANYVTGRVPLSGTGPGFIPPVTTGAPSALGMPSISNVVPLSVPTAATAGATGRAPAATPAFPFVAPTATAGVPSVPVAAPTAATLGARAVAGSKPQQSDARGPTSNRSRRRVGP